MATESTNIDIPPPSSSALQNSDVKCSCKPGEIQDTRLMVACEKCKTWQHVICELNHENEDEIPSPYFCTACEHPLIAKLKDKARRTVCLEFYKILSEIPEAQDVENLAVNIEKALFTKFRENRNARISSAVGTKYRNQFRMLSFNLKDPKNSELRLKVATSVISPGNFVTMKSADMRNPELQQVTDEIRKENLRESVLENGDQTITEENVEANLEGVQDAFLGARTTDQIDEINAQNQNVEDADIPMEDQVRDLEAQNEQDLQTEGVGIEKQLLMTKSVDLFVSNGLMSSKADLLINENFGSIGDLKIDDKWVVSGSAKQNDVFKMFSQLNREEIKPRYRVELGGLEFPNEADMVKFIHYFEVRGNYASVQKSDPRVRFLFLIPIKEFRDGKIDLEIPDSLNTRNPELIAVFVCRA